MSEFSEAAEAFLRVLTTERGASEHTVRAYAPRGEELCGLSGRSSWERGAGWRRSSICISAAYLAVLYERGLTKASTARALASVRSWFKWMAKEGRIEKNPGLLVSTPKRTQHLPTGAERGGTEPTADGFGRDGKRRCGGVAGAGSGDL